MILEVKTLRETVEDYCTNIGSDPMLVQGAGGNVSWKDENTLWIKASGTWLADAKVKDIFVPVDLHALQQSISEDDFAVSPKVKGESSLRPSIETLLHALMPHQIVIHVHAIEALAHLVRENSELEIGKKLKTDFSWAMVSYQKPGAALAEAVSRSIENNPDTQILLLQNHGVVIGGKDIEEVTDLLSKLLLKLSVEPFQNSISSMLPESIVLNNDQEYTPVDIVDIQDLALLPELFNRLKTDWVLYPDHVVFLGPVAYCYSSQKELSERLKTMEAPELIFIKDLGVFSLTDLTIAKMSQLKCYYDVLVRLPQDSKVRKLSEDQIAELLNWDAELYRQQLAIIN